MGTGRQPLTAAASGYLDLIRAFAALAVMCGHLRGMFFVDFGHIEPSKATALIKAIYALTGLGHQAVMIFFALSGFFISSSVFRAISRNAWSWREYLLDRGVRLYAVLIPGLMLGLIWDGIGIRFFNSSGIYSTPLSPFGGEVVTEALSPHVLIGNLLFLQSRFVPVFGSNGPLWSLFNEAWYYILFPSLVAIVLAAKRKSLAGVCGYLALAGSAAWVLGYQLSGFVVWLFGCGIAMLTASLQLKNLHGWLPMAYRGITLCVFCLSISGTRPPPDWWGADMAVGLTFALLLLGITTLRSGPKGHSLSISRTLAGFSFSLYVLHFPLLLLGRAILTPTVRWQPDSFHLACAALIGAGVLIYANTVASLTERNTPQIKMWLKRWRGLKSLNAA